MLSPNVVLAVLMLLKPSPVGLYLQSSGAETTATVADDVTVDWVNQKAPTTRVFARPSPAEYMKAIAENKEVLRARIVLDGSTTIEFHERPQDIDFYDSTIVVNRRGEASRSYNVGNLIKHQALSLVHVGIVPSENGAGMLVCEYEGGAVGAREGFAILRFSPSSFDLHTLPLTDFGKVVVFQGKPEQVEIWSALPDNAGSDADPRSYTTQACRWQIRGYECSPPKPGAPGSPFCWANLGSLHYAFRENAVVEIESEWTGRKREKMGMPLRVKVRELPHPSNPGLGGALPRG